MPLQYSVDRISDFLLQRGTINDTKKQAFDLALAHYYMTQGSIASSYAADGVSVGLEGCVIKCTENIFFLYVCLHMGLCFIIQLVS